jgi:hypothetical protein
MSTARETSRRLRSIALVAASASLVASCIAEEPTEQEQDQPVTVGGSALDLRDAWAAKVARIQQRDLQRSVPLERWQRIGTHNSHVSTTYTKCGDRACYYVRANQHRSISAQLAMGVRTLMLDVYDSASPWGSGDCQWGWGACFSHTGETFGQWSVEIEDEIARFINAPENKDEVLFVLLEDYFNDGGDRKMQFFNELRRRFDKDYWPGANTPPESTAGDLIFRPLDKDTDFPDRWPTPRELVRLGKRILIAVKDRGQYNVDFEAAPGVTGNMRDWFFASGSTSADAIQYPWYDANFAPHFDASSCGSTSIRDNSGSVKPLPLLFTQLEELKICDHFEYCGGLYESSTFSRRLDVKAAVDCGFSVAMDQAEADPGYKGQSGYDYYSSTFKSALFSFAEGEPNDWSSDEDCAEMRADGRWNDVTCAASRPYACKKVGARCDPESCSTDFWQLSAVSGPFAGGASSCPQGYTFGVPENGYENRKVAALASGALSWLNFTDSRVEGRWELGRYEAWSPGEPNNWSEEDCAEMRDDGRWNDVTCAGVRRFACRKEGATCGPSGCPGDLWSLSSGADTWSRDACPSGYGFAAPRSAQENAALQSVAAGQSVWLNFTDAHEEGLWESF